MRSCTLFLATLVVLVVFAPVWRMLFSMNSALRCAPVLGATQARAMYGARGAGGRAGNATVADDVTLIIKSFERPAHLDRLLGSVRQFYPTVRILVSDDSRPPAPGRAWIQRHYPSVELYTMPFDTGNSRGRNLLLSQVRTQYFLTLDDDFVFGLATRLETLLELLEKHERISIACGSVMGLRYSGKFAIDGKGVLNHVSVPVESAEMADNCEVADICPQFFMARLEAVRHFGGWDERFAVYDHNAFFVRAWQAGVQAAFCGSVDITHKAWAEDFPMPWNNTRGRGYLEVGEFLKAYNLKGIREFNGDLVDKAFADHLFDQEAESEAKRRKRTRFDSDTNTFFLSTCILSAPQNFARRTEMRGTWLQHLGPNATVAAGAQNRFVYKFVIGQVQNASLRKELEQEFARYGDIHFVPSVIDAYTNLTAKMRSCVSFMGRHYSLYVLKTDDDVYIYFNRLIERLLAPDVYRGPKNTKNVILGAQKHQRVLVDDKKYADHDFEGYTYPLLARGGAYVFSGDIASYITVNEDLFFDYVLEDASFAIWTAPLLPRKVNDSRFFQGYFEEFPHLYRESFDGIAVIETKLGQQYSLHELERISRDTTLAQPIKPKYALSDCKIPSSFHDRMRLRQADAEVQRGIDLNKYRLALIDVKAILIYKLKLDFHMMAGSVLGYALDCQPLTAATEVEIGVFAGGMSNDFVPAFEADGFKILRVSGEPSAGYVVTVEKRSAKVTIAVHYDDASVGGKGFWHGAWAGPELSKRRVAAFQPVWIDFLGVRVLAPRDMHSYLSVYYGDSWREVASMSASIGRNVIEALRPIS